MALVDSANSNRHSWLILQSRIMTIGIRFAVVCLLVCLSVYLALFSSYWLTAIWTSLGAATLFYYTLRLVNRSEIRLAAFLQAISQGDFTMGFSSGNSYENKSLQLAFHQLMGTLTKLRSEKESQHHLLQAILADAAVPLICYDENTGDVYLTNKAALNLFGLPFLRSLQSLQRVDPSLPSLLTKLSNEKTSLKLVLNKRLVYLSVMSRQLQFENKPLKLLVLTDVTSELAARDADAWQKLLRVLTHEISNSAIPLSTLSGVVHDIVSNAEQAKRSLNDEERQDVLIGLKTIGDRSRSLRNFVTTYKSINAIPEPNVARTSLYSIVQDAKVLFAKDLELKNVRLTVNVPENAYIMADRELTMNALINIIKNAVEAMEENSYDKHLILSVTYPGPSFLGLEISDNGCGIPKDDSEHIFVPFYSTKKGGSGIGLSIAYQIMQKQRGDLSMISEVGKGSVFTASFIKG